MFINIITPCSRPQHLKKIGESINIPVSHYRWLVCFDGEEIPKVQAPLYEAYALKDEKSKMGNAQRNLCLSKVQTGWIYFLDDDTILHPDFWKYISPLLSMDYDFISFDQAFPDGSKRLNGSKVFCGNIDSGNFIFHHSLLGESRWVLDKYEADGIFATEVYHKASKPLYIPNNLSVYNSLR